MSEKEIVAGKVQLKASEIIKRAASTHGLDPNVDKLIREAALEGMKIAMLETETLQARVEKLEDMRLKVMEILHNPTDDNQAILDAYAAAAWIKEQGS